MRILVLGGDATGITVTNNLYVAPNYVTGGTGSAAPLQIHDKDLSSFKLITDNVWPMPTFGALAKGGINYVEDSDGYKTPAEWDAFVQVKHDQYKDVALSSSYMIKLEGVSAGADMDR